MDAPPSAPKDAGPMGCLAALAIGVLIVAAETCAFSLLTGMPLDFADEWGVLLFQMLIVAAPFAFLALAGIGDKLPWLVGLGLTLALWGYVLFDGVSYQWHPDGSGANIGLGLFMLASPLFITVACFGVRAWQLWRGRPRSR
jgi:hypothetical protein